MTLLNTTSATAYINDLSSMFNAHMSDFAECTANAVTRSAYAATFAENAVDYANDRVNDFCKQFDFAITMSFTEDDEQLYTATKLVQCDDKNVIVVISVVSNECDALAVATINATAM